MEGGEGRKDRPFPEGIIQELNRGVAHGGFSLSDQPVFVLQRRWRENKSDVHFFREDILKDVRKVPREVEPSRGC